LTDTNCIKLKTEHDTDAFKLASVFDLKVLTDDMQNHKKVDKSIQIFNKYDTNMKNSISGNNNKIYFAGIQAAKTNILNLLDTFDSTKTHV